MSLRYWTSPIGTVVLLLGITLSSFTGYGETISACQETTEEGTPGGQTGYTVDEDVDFTGVDGVTIDGRLYVPDPKESLHTGVVTYHGFGGSKDDLSWIAESLAEKGCVVLTYDHRGHGGSGGDFDWGKLVKDAKTAIISLLDECPDIDRIVVIGHSVGGMIAMRVAAGDSEISTTVSLSTPESLTESLNSIISYQFKKLVDYIKDLPLTAATSSRSYPVKEKPLAGNLHRDCYKDLPKFYLESCSPRYRPMYYLAEVGKILFLQGTADHTANPEGALKMYEKAAGPKALIFIENAGHTLTETLNEGELEQISECIYGWIEDCSPGKNLNG